MSDLVGYLVISIPILVILAVVFWPQLYSRWSGKSSREGFLNLGDIGQTLTDKFESTFFSPPPAPAAPTETLEGGPAPADGSVGDGPMPGVVEVTLPEESAKERRPMDCKFIGAGRECPVGYEPTGAHFGIKGAKLECGESTVEREAKAVATIKNGEITKVTVIDGGLGYPSAPLVEFVGGDGQGAQGSAFIDDAGTVQVVEIVTGGTGYRSTPEVVLRSEGSERCTLCCRT